MGARLECVDGDKDDNEGENLEESRSGNCVGDLIGVGTLGSCGAGVVWALAERPES